MSRGTGNVNGRAKMLTVVSFLLLHAINTAASGPSAVASVLERAAERALSYDRAALDWTCEETLREGRYDSRGEANREREQHFALLLARDSAGQVPVEFRAAGGTARLPEARRPRMIEGFPPVTSWLRLFHPEAGGSFLVQDGGVDSGGAVPRHAFTFRGAVPYSDGRDFREWEGTAWVDPLTGNLLALDALPSSQNDRLAALVDRRNRHSVGFTFFGLLFRIGPKVDGRHVEVSFGAHEGGFWLPTVARMETFEAVTRTTTSRKMVVVDTIDRCRRFESNATPGESTPIPR